MMYGRVCELIVKLKKRNSKVLLRNPKFIKVRNIFFAAFLMRWKFCWLIYLACSRLFSHNVPHLSYCKKINTEA